MKITYLYHSGIMIELTTHVLIFDYYKGSIPHIPSHKKVFVFVSHNHEDHYQPAIFKLLSYHNNVTYIFDHDISSHYPYHACHPNETHIINDINVTTFASNDEGIAFLVEVEGKRIYHSGDLHLWNWIPETKADEAFLIWQKQVFEEAMHQLSHYEIDLACYPIDPRLKSHTLDGIHEFLVNITVKDVIGIHFADAYETVKEIISHDSLLSCNQHLHILAPQTQIIL